MTDEKLFEPAGLRSGKDRCTACGRTGYPWGKWKDVCRNGHAPAPCCGKVLSVLRNGAARSHSRKPIGCIGTGERT